MKKKRKISMVELIIVLSVLIILTGVTFVGVTSFTKQDTPKDPVDQNKPNEQPVETSDFLTSQLNSILNDARAKGGANKTPYDAIIDLKKGGFDLPKLKHSNNDYEYYYDLSQDMVFLLSGDKVIAPLNKNTSTNHTDLFKFINKGEILSEVYSNYLDTDYIADETLKISTGLDVGDNDTVKSLSYENLNSSKNVLLRTNGGELTVNAPLDNIDHYGTLTSGNIIAVADNSYHEYGTTNHISIKQGRVELLKSALTEKITVPTDAKSVSIKIEQIENNPLIDIKTEKENCVSLNSSVKVYVNTVNNNTITNTNPEIELVSASKVTSEEELISAINEKEAYIMLSSDIILTKVIDVVECEFKIDLNGHNMINKLPKGRPFNLVKSNVEFYNGKFTSGVEDGYGVFSLNENISLALKDLVIGDENKTYFTDNGAIIRVGNSSDLTRDGLINIDNVTSYVDHCFINIGGNGGIYNFNVYNSMFVLKNDDVNSTTPCFKLYNTESCFNNVTIETIETVGVEVIGGRATLDKTNVTVLETNDIQGWSASALFLGSGSEIVVNSGNYIALNGYALYIPNSGGSATINGGRFIGNKAALQLDQYENHGTEYQDCFKQFEGVLIKEDTFETTYGPYNYRYISGKIYNNIEEFIRAASVCKVNNGVFTGDVNVQKNFDFTVNGGDFTIDVTQWS